jgi:hypothetical protein
MNSCFLPLGKDFISVESRFMPKALKKLPGDSSIKTNVPNLEKSLKIKEM